MVRKSGIYPDENDEWQLNTLEIDIDKVRFPIRAEIGKKPEPAYNEILIEIDEANAPQSRETWCTAIGWASLEIKAMSPVVLIHGNNAEKRAFGKQFEDGGFTSALDAAHLLYDWKNITLITGSIAFGGFQLATLVPMVLDSFGVDSAHLVAHSKGGMDTRQFLAENAKKNSTDHNYLSLTTLATPHDGSAGADFFVNKGHFLRAATSFYSNLSPATSILGRYVPSTYGLEDVRTKAVRPFNATNIPLYRDRRRTWPLAPTLTSTKAARWTNLLNMQA